MQVFPDKRQEENCSGRYLKGLRNQKEQHLVNLLESKELETQIIFLFNAFKKRSVWAYNFMANKISRRLNINFFDKKYILLFCFTMYSTLLVTSYFLSTKVMFRLLVMLFAIKSYSL